MVRDAKRPHVHHVLADLRSTVYLQTGLRNVSGNLLVSVLLFSSISIKEVSVSLIGLLWELRGRCCEPLQNCMCLLGKGCVDNRTCYG
jgi:hypothetical protein